MSDFITAGDEQDGGESKRYIKDELHDLVESSIPFTDLLIAENCPVKAKVLGEWRDVEGFAPPDTNAMEILLQEVDTDWAGSMEKYAPINRTMELENWRLRVNAYLSFGGKQKMMAIRRIPRNTPDLNQTGLPQSIKFMIEAPRGLILIVGATGSGKSTTIAALVDHINRSCNDHIITIEDPIEYLHIPMKSVFSQREVGVDTENFNTGVREAMRQSPNVIVIGEISDVDTASAALLAGESGHLVIGSLHANSCVGGLKKLIGLFPDNERNARLQSLASSLVGVVSQILLPRIDGTGHALAAELLFNHRQVYSELIASGDMSRIQSKVSNKEDPLTVSLADSMTDLIKSGQVSKANALNATIGQAEVNDRIKKIED